jgi:hypothetical protein
MAWAGWESTYTEGVSLADLAGLLIVSGNVHLIREELPIMVYVVVIWTYVSAIWASTPGKGDFGGGRLTGIDKLLAVSLAFLDPSLLPLDGILLGQDIPHRVLPLRQPPLVNKRELEPVIVDNMETLSAGQGFSDYTPVSEKNGDVRRHGSMSDMSNLTPWNSLVELLLCAEEVSDRLVKFVGEDAPAEVCPALEVFGYELAGEWTGCGYDALSEYLSDHVEGVWVWVTARKSWEGRVPSGRNKWPCLEVHTGI